MISCPNCHMFQTQGLSFYGNCQHCGWSFNDTRKAQGRLRDEIHITSLTKIINQQSTRIAELEAELASLKDPYRIFTEWQNDQIRKLEDIKQQSATDFEEGEG